MSQTSIRAGTCTSLSKRTVTTTRTEKKLTRRYSDCNIVFLEGHERVSVEDQKTKITMKREELLKGFKERFIVKGESVTKKFADGGRYEGAMNEANEKHGKGIYYFANGDLYLGDFYRNALEG